LGAEFGVPEVARLKVDDMFIEIPPHIADSDFVRRAKGRLLRKIQQDFENVPKRYWGQRIWARGCFSPTSGNITDQAILNHPNEHGQKHG
jgi:putative transposase